MDLTAVWTNKLQVHTPPGLDITGMSPLQLCLEDAI